MSNKYGFLQGLVLGSILWVPLSSYSSDDIKEAATDDAAVVASEASDDAAEAANEATDDAAEVAGDAVDDAADASDADVDDTDRCRDVSSNLPEGHPCYIPPR